MSGNYDVLTFRSSASSFNNHCHGLIPLAEHHASSINSSAYYNGVSENAARRTPQPAANAVMAESVPFDPYATQNLQSLVTDSPLSYGGASGPSSAFTNHSSLHAPSASSQASLNDRSSPYDPYAPPALANAASYVPKRSVSGFTAARAGVSNPTMSAAPKPDPPKRMASNAYDPPFLKPQKSFVRSASAIPTIAPAFAAPSMMSAPSIPESHAAPPNAPPRRSQTDQRQLNRSFSYAAPPQSQSGRQELSRSVARISTTRDAAAGRAAFATQDSYASSPSVHPYGSAEGSYKPPQRPTSAAAPTREPPRIASYTAFDPPLRSASHSARSPYVAPPNPPPVFSPSPVEQEQAPPRSGRRTPLQRASPIFPARPSSRSSPMDHVQSVMNAAVRDGYRSPPPDITNTRNDHFSDDLSSDQQRRSLLMLETDSGEIEHDRQASFETELEYKDKSLPSSTDDHQSAALGTDLCYPQDRNRYPGMSSPVSGLSLDQIGSPPPKMTVQPPYDPYVPTSNGYDNHNASSPYTANLVTHEYDPNNRQQIPSYEPGFYAPSSSRLIDPSLEQHLSVQSPNHGNHLGSSSAPADYFRSTTQQDDTYVPQQVLEQRPISEDPLGRSTLAARNLPLAVFGFGGILITAFPAAADDSSAVGHMRTPSYGYASGRGQIWLRRVSDLVADSALRSQNVEFPGPLVFDPTSLKGVAGDKKKRDAVMAYLEKRAEEIEQGLPYLKSSASRARRDQEGKLVLLRLLAAMIDGDGKLLGRLAFSPAIRMSCLCPNTVQRLKRTSAVPCNLHPHR